MTLPSEDCRPEGRAVPAAGRTVVVIGGSNVDVKARCATSVDLHTSNPGLTSTSPGGVARNIAENISRLGDRVELISVVGRDSSGDDLLAHTAAAGVGTGHVVRTDRPTGSYTAVLDADGELVVAVADMEAAAELGRDHVDRCRELISGAGLLVLDANLPPDTLDRALDLSGDVVTLLDPVGVAKAARVADAIDGRVDVVTPNRGELAALVDLPTQTDRQLRTAALALHERGVAVVWVRLGERGSLLSTSERSVEIPALPAVVQDVTGAGDSMVGAFCHVVLQGGSFEDAARFGHAAAALTIASPDTVRRDLSDDLVRSALDRDRRERVRTDGGADTSPIDRERLVAAMIDAAMTDESIADASRTGTSRTGTEAAAPTDEDSSR